MLNYDLSPFYRSTVGFDRLLSMLDKAVGAEQSVPSYPPYNIERTGENAYRITLAVAGFSENELASIPRDNTLTIRGGKESPAKDEKRDVHLSGHRRSRLREALPACRPCRRHRRGERERIAPYRSGPGSSRGAEAARDRHQGRARPSRPRLSRRRSRLRKAGQPVQIRAPERAPFLLPIRGG